MKKIECTHKIQWFNIIKNRNINISLFNIVHNWFKILISCKTIFLFKNIYNSIWRYFIWQFVWMFVFRLDKYAFFWHENKQNIERKPWNKLLDFAFWLLHQMMKKSYFIKFITEILAPPIESYIDYISGRAIIAGIVPSPGKTCNLFPFQKT